MTMEELRNPDRKRVLKSARAKAHSNRELAVEITKFDLWIATRMANPAVKSVGYMFDSDSSSEDAYFDWATSFGLGADLSMDLSGFWGISTAFAEWSGFHYYAEVTNRRRKLQKAKLAPAMLPSAEDSILAIPVAKKIAVTDAEIYDKAMKDKTELKYDATIDKQQSDLSSLQAVKYDPQVEKEASTTEALFGLVYPGTCIGGMNKASAPLPEVVYKDVCTEFEVIKDEVCTVEKVAYTITPDAIETQVEVCMEDFVVSDVCDDYVEDYKKCDPKFEHCELTEEEIIEKEKELMFEQAKSDPELMKEMEEAIPDFEKEMKKKEEEKKKKPELPEGKIPEGEPPKMLKRRRLTVKAFEDTVKNAGKCSQTVMVYKECKTETEKTYAASYTVYDTVKKCETVDKQGPCAKYDQVEVTTRRQLSSGTTLLAPAAYASILYKTKGTTGDEKYVVAFQGTKFDEPAMLLYTLSKEPVYVAYGPASTVTTLGFAMYIAQLFPCMVEQASSIKDSIDYITGHSLGGAAATLFKLFATDAFDIVSTSELVTFGAPPTSPYGKVKLKGQYSIDKDMLYDTVTPSGTFKTDVEGIRFFHKFDPVAGFYFNFGMWTHAVSDAYMVYDTEAVGKCGAPTFANGDSSYDYADYDAAYDYATEPELAKLKSFLCTSYGVEPKTWKSPASYYSYTNAMNPAPCGEASLAFVYAYLDSFPELTMPPEKPVWTPMESYDQCAESYLATIDAYAITYFTSSLMTMNEAYDIDLTAPLVDILSYDPTFILWFYGVWGLWWIHSAYPNYGLDGETKGASEDYGLIEFGEDPMVQMMDTVYTNLKSENKALFNFVENPSEDTLPVY